MSRIFFLLFIVASLYSSAIVALCNSSAEYYQKQVLRQKKIEASCCMLCYECGRHPYDVYEGRELCTYSTTNTSWTQLVSSSGALHMEYTLLLQEAQTLGSSESEYHALCSKSTEVAHCLLKVKGLIKEKEQLDSGLSAHCTSILSYLGSLFCFPLRTSLECCGGYLETGEGALVVPSIYTNYDRGVQLFQLREKLTLLQVELNKKIDDAKPKNFKEEHEQIEIVEL